MTIRVIDQFVVLGQHRIAPAEFPALVLAHLAHVPGTEDTEDFGARVQLEDRPADEWKRFVRDVIDWGGGQRFVRSPVMDRNTPTRIKSTLNQAIEKLAERPPDIGGALTTVKWIDGLSISFGSKVLRFLRPDICPVLDKVIREAAVYSEDTPSYCLYAAEAIRIARMLETCKIENPRHRLDGGWFAGDVDMGLYARLKGWA